MPIVAILIGGLALLAIFEMRKPGAAASPVVYPPLQQPTYPGQSAPTGGKVLVGGSVVDELAPSAVSDASQEAANLMQSTSSALSSAIPIVGGVLASITGALLAAHTARMTDAKNENQAVSTAIPNWQQDFISIARAGSYPRAYRMAQCDLLTQQTMAYLQKQVGKPGTAWSGAPSGCPGSDVPKTENGSHPCGKSCTVGCCIFYSYLEPAVDCLKKRIAKGGNQAVGIPTIPGNKYGFPVFPGFTVQIVPSNS